MTLDVEYASNRASEAEIRKHLRQCDAHFVPPLSKRVSIEQYARKIVDRAVRFEAWADGELVGLVAAYIDRPSAQVSFITNVSVLPGWTGTGTALGLLSNCIEHVRATGCRRVALEVGAENHRALALYKRLRFVAGEVREGNIPMELDLEKKES